MTRIVKNFGIGSKSLANKDCRKFGKLKSIYIGNVIEIVKNGKNLANYCNSPQFIYHQCFVLYGMIFALIYS